MTGALFRLTFQLFFVDIFKEIKNKLNKNLISKNLLKQFFFNFSFITSLIIMPTIARSWSSTISDGSLTFSYSSKLIELPLGAVNGSLTTVLLQNFLKIYRLKIL